MSAPTGIRPCAWCRTIARYATEDGAACEQHRRLLELVAEKRLGAAGHPHADVAAEALVAGSVVEVMS